MKSKTSLYSFLLILISIGLISVAKVNQYADQLLQAEKDGKPIPVLTINSPTLNIETAYKIQKDYVKSRLKNDKIAGFKAGLTSKGTQEKFGVDSPVSGVLFSSGKHSSPYPIESSKFQKLMIEAEIGYIVGKPITSMIKDIPELKKHIKEILPVIEFPELGFEDLEKVKAEDIIAANISSRAFIIGKPTKVDKINTDDVRVTLNLNVEIVNKGRGSDLTGGQWDTLLWLVNNVVSEGWEIEPGQILITGALGEVVKARKGHYIATFGSLGVIDFRIH